MMALLLFRGLGSAALLVGGVLFAAWAIRYLPANKLKVLAAWCVAIGIALILLTSFFIPPNVYNLRERQFMQEQLRF